jgi:hypothetical protein
VNLGNVPKWATALKVEAEQILGQVESSKARRVTLDASYKNLGNLSLKQDDLFRQALRCVEFELYRAAHVMAWAAFVDFLHQYLVDKRLQQLQAARPKWNVIHAEDLRLYTDYQVIEVAAVVGLLTKPVSKGLQGLLSKRNECAHPEDYFPGLNDTLGYIDELFKRAEFIRDRLP